MRKVFALSLIALLLGVGVVAMIETEPGYVLISYGDYTVETSLWVGIVLVGLIVLVLYGLLHLLTALLESPRSFFNWRKGRKAGHASRLTSRGLINFIEGNWSKARNQLLKGAEGNEAPLLNYLIAARASYQLGDADKMRQRVKSVCDKFNEACMLTPGSRLDDAMDAIVQRLLLPESCPREILAWLSRET